MYLLNVVEYIVTSGIMIVGSAVLTTLGFGLGIVTTPFLLLYLDPKFSIIIVNFCGILIPACMLLHSRKGLNVKVIFPITISGAIGAVFGVFIFNVVSQGFLRIAICGLILMLIAMVVFKVEWSNILSNRILALTGFFVGLLLTCLGTGAPILIMMLIARNWGKQVIRSTMAPFFLVIHSIALAGFLFAGNI